MNNYITFRENDDNGELQYYILQREFPHFIGIVSDKFKVGNWYAPIIGYRMYVNFSGTLRGNIIPSYKDIGKEIEEVMFAMSDWYLTNRILTDEKRYKKFKVNAPSPIQ